MKRWASQGRFYKPTSRFFLRPAFHSPHRPKANSNTLSIIILPPSSSCCRCSSPQYSTFCTSELDNFCDFYTIFLSLPPFMYDDKVNFLPNMNSNPTDEELDRDWQPNGRRPQSTIARSFSQELMDIFRIESSLTDLDEQINKRKQQVTSGQTELEALEARIKEMEERLKQQNPAAVSSMAPRQTAGDAFGKTASTEKELAQQQRSRPGTAKQVQQAPAHGGAMPPTPTASEDGGDRDN